MPKITFAIILLLTKLASNVKLARFNDKIPRNHGKPSLNLAILTLLASFVNNKIIVSVILGAGLPWSRNGNARWGFIEEVSIFSAE
jgi:hypothetical protein